MAQGICAIHSKDTTFLLSIHERVSKAMDRLIKPPLARAMVEAVYNTI